MRDSPTASTIAPALRMLLAYQAITSNYHIYLKTSVFTKDRSRRDEVRVKLEKALEGSESLIVLTLLWRESEFITMSERNQVYLNRQFPNGVTCNELGMQLSDSVRVVGATTARVRTIINAAERFGLVSKKIVRTKKHNLVGTSDLHEMMRNLGLINADSLEAFGLTWMSSLNQKPGFDVAPGSDL